MSTHVTLADQALMEKLANCAPEEEAPEGGQVKTASAPDARGKTAAAMQKAAQVVAASRRVGMARADAEIAALLDR